jgi:hypothetical protein
MKKEGKERKRKEGRKEKRKKEDYKSISLMITDAKILNETAN